MVLLDFSKAFDSLNHSMLLSKLSSEFGFESSAVRLLGDYLSERFQCVSIFGHVSNPLLNGTGIPQGSVLGPLLFSLYINDLPTCLRAVDHHMFADDVQLFHSFERPNLNGAIFRMNQDLYEVSKWARRNFLSLNARKSQAIVFSELSDALLKLDLFPRILLDGVVIPYSDTVLDLGLLMDKKLTFKSQVDAICSNVFSRLRSLWPNGHLFSVKIRTMLVKSLIMPAFTYGECVYSTNLSVSDVRSLERAYSACVRFVYGLRRYDSTRRYVSKVLGCPLMSYIKHRRCCAVHSIAKLNAPSYLSDKLVRGTSSRSAVFVIPRHSSRQYNRSFFVRAVSDYNSLPVEVRKIGSVAGFGRACLDYVRTH